MKNFLFFPDEAELRLDDLIKSLHKPSVTTTSTPTKSSSDGSSGASSATSFKHTVSISLKIMIKMHSTKKQIFFVKIIKITSIF